MNESELKDICFNSSIGYDNLGGQNKADKARELVEHFDRRDWLLDLINTAKSVCQKCRLPSQLRELSALQKELEALNPPHNFHPQGKQRWIAYMSLMALTLLVFAVARVGAGKISGLPFLPDPPPVSSEPVPAMIPQIPVSSPGAIASPLPETQDPPPPDPPCLQGQILFASDRDSDLEIYTMNPYGSEVRQLTNNADMDILPRWSSEHSRIVFVSNRDGQGPDKGDLYIMDADGQNVDRLTTAGGDDPVWSHDGKQIAFSSDREGNYEIYVMNVDGTNVRRLTMNNVWDARPSWSPDDSQIVYSSRASGKYEEGPWDLHVVNSDETGNITIVSDSSRNTRPVWSPDGVKIAYVTDRHTNWEIYTVDPDGQNPERLTNDVAPDVEVAWSPDSQCLAFVRELSGENRNIYLIDAHGGNLQRLTNHSQKDGYIFWSEATK